MKKAERRVPDPVVDPRDDAYTPEEIFRIVKRYAGLSSRMYGEVTVRLVPCPACGADIDEGCVGQYDQRSNTSLHADRRVAAERWWKKNPDEWAKFKDAMLLHLIKMKKAGLI